MSTQIFRELNPPGARDGDSTAELTFDLHAQGTADAKRRFDELFAPLLKSKSSIVLIVGRGSHSQSGCAHLRSAMIGHLRREGFPYSPVESNAGRIRVYPRGAALGAVSGEVEVA